MLLLFVRLLFQSTRPARGATPEPKKVKTPLKFQSTRPARGATIMDWFGDTFFIISIHAPREGRDIIRTIFTPNIPYFNPRAPRGARLTPRGQRSESLRFQSTRPARGATVGADALRQYQSRFQSTRPARGATAKVNKFLCTFLQKRHGFQIFLRKTLPFKAFCRLQIGKNFSICGANRCGNFCELLLRTIRSSVLPEGRSACSQNAQFYSHTFSRDNRNADCLFPDP